MEKEKLARIVVFVVIAGLVGSSLPLIFAPQPSAPNNDLPAGSTGSPQATDQSASLAPAASNSSAKPEQKPEVKKENSPDGFGGIEEEKDSLEDLENLLNE